MSVKTIKPLALVMGTAFAASMTATATVSADENPFAMKPLAEGFNLASAEGKCGEGKCGEGKCGEDKKAKEGKCGEGKCGEGKCGGDKKAKEGKCGEGKCGEGKCGSK